MLTLAILQRRWPVPPAKNRSVQGMANTSGVLSQLGIKTPLRMAHFMAQISAESGNGRHMTESLNYSAERMMQVFPNRFPTLASTQGFAHNERAFGNKVYNGRMGNRVGSDDGFNFRGRGPLQLTGHDNYENIGRSLGLDFVNNPDLVIAPQNVLLIAGTEFVKSGCLPRLRPGQRGPGLGADQRWQCQRQPGKDQRTGRAQEATTRKSGSMNSASLKLKAAR